MKQLFNILILCCLTTSAQIKGNESINTKIYPFDGVETIKIDLYAAITIDMSQEASLSITTDSNLFKFIDTEIVDGTIHLSQLKWIQPSSGIVIKIGAPLLKNLIHDTHDTTKLMNVNNNELSINANIGKVIAQGQTKKLRIGSENGNIDASKLIVKEVYVNLWSWGTITVNPTDYLWADVSEEGKLFYLNLPEKNNIKTKSGAIATSISNKAGLTKEKNIKWIRFKIKNNSNNRNHFVVKGPKPDGSYFGYGFPMMPNSKRKENWSVGTKIYKQSKLGFKKLLVTIKAEDEDQVVNLFN